MSETPDSADNCAAPAPKRVGRPFAPGTDARRNLGGRPKGLAALVREKCSHGVPLVDWLLTVATGQEAGTDADLRFKATQELLNRGWGKPQQSLDITGTLGLGELADDQLDALIAARQAQLDALGDAL